MRGDEVYRLLASELIVYAATRYLFRLKKSIYFQHAIESKASASLNTLGSFKRALHKANA